MGWVSPSNQVSDGGPDRIRIQNTWVILKYAGTMAPMAPMAPILLVVGEAKAEL